MKTSYIDRILATGMDASEAEREWLRRISGGQSSKVKKSSAGNEKEAVERREPTNAVGETGHGQHGADLREAEKGHGFKDIAGMDKLKELVTEGFVNVLKNRKWADVYGIKPPSMLLYGPAGCGKTFFAEKMAEEVGIHFMKIVPDDLACTWIHGTQEKIGKVFKNAEKTAPTLLFFDEFDAMVARRSGNEANQHYDSEVNEFLCCLGNASDRGVYVLAATNHPERIDKAVLRTGRIDEMVYVGMPDKAARDSLFSLSLSKLPSDDGIDTHRLAELTEGYNCSDICYIVQSAARKMFNATVKDGKGKCLPIDQALLEEIISRKRPSVSDRDLREYERIRSEYSPKDEECRHGAIGFR